MISFVELKQVGYFRFFLIVLLIFFVGFFLYFIIGSNLVNFTQSTCKTITPFLDCGGAQGFFAYLGIGASALGSGLIYKFTAKLALWKITVFLIIVILINFIGGYILKLLYEQGNKTE